MLVRDHPNESIWGARSNPVGIEIFNNGLSRRIIDLWKQRDSLLKVSGVPHAVYQIEPRKGRFILPDVQTRNVEFFEVICRQWLRIAFHQITIVQSVDPRGVGRLQHLNTIPENLAGETEPEVVITKQSKRIVADG